MEGKTCVITGANSGIGYETAKALAHQGANVILLCRNPEKGKTALTMMAKETQNPYLHLYTADLASQDAIRAAAAKILDKFETIDVLVNNAGTWFSKLTETEDGIEMVFAVNHLAYFLLTHLLMPALVRAEHARVISVGSDSHFKGKMNFEDISLSKRYHGLRSYAQSKLANCLFTYELDRKLRSNNINHVDANCVQPGLVKTDIGVKNTISLHSLAWKVRRSGGVTPAEGAKTNIYLASSPEVVGESGKYWDKCQPKPSSKRSYIEEDAQQLWDMSMNLCRIPNYFP